MKDKFKKDKKSLLLIGYSIGLILAFVIGSVITNNSISSLSKRMNAPANANFSDDALYRCVIDEYNEENNANKPYSANLTDAELQTIKNLTCGNEGVSDIAGIEKLTSLEELDLSNNEITSLTFSPGPGQSTKIYLSSLSELKKIILDNNQITKGYYGLGISNLSNLEYLSIKNNQLTGFNGDNHRDEHGQEVKDYAYTIQNTNLKYLDVSHNNLSNINLSKATLLTDLHVDNNQLKNINLSSNTNLTTERTTISGNPFEEDVYVFKYNGKGIKVGSPITLPESVDFGTITWGQSSDSNIATIDNNQIIKPTGNIGNVTISGNAGNNYTTTSNIHVIGLNLNSSKYKLRLPVANTSDGFSYLWIGSDVTKSSSEVESNLSLTGSVSSSLSIIIANVGDDFLDPQAVLLIRDTNRGRDIAEIPIYGATSSVDYYNVDSDYIYDGNHSSISATTGLTNRLENSKFVLQTSQYRNVKEYNLVKFTSSKFDINIDSDYIWIGTNTINQGVVDDTINVTNGNMVYNSTNNTLTLKDGAGADIKTWDIIGWSSNKYDLNGEYVSNTTGTDMYVNLKGNSSFNINDVNVINGSIEEYRTTITGTSSTVFRYWILKSKNGDVVKKFDTVSFTSSKYDKYFSKDYIDIRNGEITASDFTTDSSSTVVNISDNKVYITNGPPRPDGSYDGIYKQWDIVSYKSDKYDLDGNYIYVGTDDSIETITSNITSTNVTFRKNDYNQLEFAHGDEVIKTMDIIYCNSDYYDLSKRYIFTGSVSNEFIKSKIDYDDANSSLDIVDNNLVLKSSNGETIKSWKLVRCETEGYLIGKSYAIQKPTYSASDIEVINGSYEGKTPQGYLSISYNGETKEVPIINFKSTNNRYNLEKTFTGHDSYIYLGTEDLDTTNIRLWFQTHADVTEQLPDEFKLNIANDYLTATIGGEHVYSWKLVKISSEYEITEQSHPFIFVNDENFDINKMHVTFEIIPFGFKVVDGVLYYGNVYAPTVAQEGRWPIINIKSNKYNIGKDTITINDDEFDIDNIDVQVPSSATYTHSYDDGIYTITVNETSKTYTKRYSVENSKFKDNNLYKCVVDGYNEKHPGEDVSYDDVLSTEQLATVEKVSCNGTDKLDLQKVTDTTGLNLLTGLKYLYLKDNKINNIDVTSNTALIDLEVGGNNLSSIDVTRNAALKKLFIDDNNISSLTVGGNRQLENLGASNAGLSFISLSSNFDIKDVNLAHNNLTFIDLRLNTNLTNLKISDNKLTSIDVSNNTALQTIDVSNNRLTSLDLSHNTSLSSDKTEIDSNQYHKNIDLDLDVPTEIDSPVKLPAHLNWPNPTYTLELPSYATIDGNMITAKKVGTFGLLGSVTDKYTFTISCAADGDYYTAVNPEKYDLAKQYLFVEGSFNISDAIATKGAAEAQYDENDSIAKVVVGDQVINQWDVLSIKSDTYIISDNKIYVGNNQILSEFESKINKKKLDMNVSDVNGNSIVDTGDTVTFTNTTHNFSKTYDISSDGIDYGDLEIDGDIIKNVKVGTRLSEIANKIEANGATITTLDKDGNIVDREARTGDQIVITWDSGNIITFRVSVLGDVYEDGKITNDDVSKLNRYFAKLKNPDNPDFPDDWNITEDYVIKAGDVSKDGKITNDDVAKLNRYFAKLKNPDNPDFPDDWLINFIKLGVVSMGGAGYEK